MNKEKKEVVHSQRSSESETTLDKNLIDEVFIEGYKQGKRDGLDGIHIAPRCALKHFLKNYEASALFSRVVNTFSARKSDFH